MKPIDDVHTLNDVARIKNASDKISDLRLRDGFDPPHEKGPQPLVDPAEAIAIALSMVPSMGKRLLSPEGVEVRQVLLALKLAGWKIEPI
jgi:hypothetical protein